MKCAPKSEHKPVMKPEYRSLGVQPFSPIDNKKQICEVTSLFNKDKNTIEVTEVTKTSTPKNNKVFLDCRIELSPIQTSLHSRTELPSLSEHADIRDKHNPSKLNCYLMSRYDWVELNKKFILCGTWNRPQAIVKREIDRLPSLPDSFIGDIALGRDQVDIVAKKDVPSDILQRLNMHYPICIEPDGNCFCRSISLLIFGSEDHHVEIRCRIVIDSVLNLENYTDHDYLMRCVNHVHKNCSNIDGYYCCYSGVKNVGNHDQSLKGIQSVFREDVMRICNLKEYCGPWQFHSAANVLTSKLVMVFPSRNIQLDVRTDFNHVFCPSEIDSNKRKKFGLLWTSVCSDNRNIHNHVVPLITR